MIKNRKYKQQVEGKQRKGVDTSEREKKEIED